MGYFLAASLAIGAYQNYVGYQNQKREYRAAERARARNTEYAHQEAAHNLNLLAQRRLQEEENAKLAEHSNRIASLEAAATAEVKASAAGVKGLSVEALVHDVYRQEAVNNEMIALGLRRTNAQLDEEAVAVRFEERSRIEGFRMPARPRASLFFWNAVGGGVGALLQSYRPGPISPTTPATE